jgi:hypothetical protein
MTGSHLRPRGIVLRAPAGSVVFYPVGKSPRGEKPPWGKAPVGKSPRGENPTWGKAPVGKSPRGENPTWGKAPVGKSPRGEKPPWGKAPVGLDRIDVSFLPSLFQYLLHLFIRFPIRY